MNLSLKLLTRAAFALAVASAAIGCGPASPFLPLFEDDEGDPGGFGPIGFTMPASATYVDTTFTMEASGKGISRVFFFVDGQLVEEDSQSPYRHEVDPSAFPEGFVLTVQARVFGNEGSERAEDAEIIIRRPRPPLSVIVGAVDALPDGFWYEVPRTWMADSAWPDPNLEYGSVSQIIKSASGGTFDTARNRLIVWGGGGPRGIWRNEIYAFDLRTFDWIRLTDASPWPPGEEGNPNNLVTHPDNAPVTRHSYDCIEYIPAPIDKLYVGGGIVEAFQNGGDPKVYLFDITAGIWEPSTMAVTASNRGSFTAVDDNGIVWQHGSGTGPYARLTQVDVTTGTETLHSEWQAARGNGSVADFDPNRNMLVNIGEGKTATWDLSNPSAPVVVRPTTGPKDAEDFFAPGMAFHPPSGKMIAWIGGSSVYALDLDTWAWTEIEAVGGPNPGLPTERGTYGRFRYSAETDVFVVVNDVRKNVFVFRVPE